MSSMMIRPMTQKIALNVNLTTPKQMSNNVFISLQFCMLHLIDGLAYINRFQKKTSDKSAESFGHHLMYAKV